MTDWTTYTQRYRRGEWRATIFRDMILADLHACPHPPAVLDIGCGNGFDGELEPQQQIAAAAGRFVGVEPDPHVELAPYFDEAHRCLFEDAALAPGSIDLAYCVMVLEHLPRPERFWDRLYEVLAPRGVFWGFTVDARHWFCQASTWFKRLRVKDLYLHRLMDQPEEELYQNYPTHYRVNTPADIAHFTRRFGRTDFVNFLRVGQLDYYLPRWLRPLSARLDRSLLARGKPGALLAVRVVKGGG